MKSVSTIFFICLCFTGGRTALFSRKATVTSSSDAEQNGRKVVCYYTPTGYFPASKVPSKACTHLIYAFGSLSGGASPNITTPTAGVRSIWNTLISLRRENPALKVLLSLQEGFPDVVTADVQKMQRFAVNAVAFLRYYRFDGVDMDWEYPNSSQKTDFANFFSIIRTAIQKDAQASRKPALLLSLALPNNQIVASRSYNLPAIARAVDFATAMTYDFHVYNKKDNRTGYNSPLYTPKGEWRYLSASEMAKYYKSQGFPPSKLLLGIPTYGRSWKLAQPSSHGLHAPAVGKGDPGPYRHLTGIYTYPDSCVALKQGAARVADTEAGAVYLYHALTWVAYDDVITVKTKCEWVKAEGLGGVGVWAMHIDDVDGKCGQGGPLPLIRTMMETLQAPLPRPLLYTATDAKVTEKPNNEWVHSLVSNADQDEEVARFTLFWLSAKDSDLPRQHERSNDAVFFMQNADPRLNES